MSDDRANHDRQTPRRRVARGTSAGWRPTIADACGRDRSRHGVSRAICSTSCVAAGCFRLLRPASHGGIGADLPSAHAGHRVARPGRRVGRLDRDDRIDCVVRPRRLPRASFDALFAGGPDAIVAGAFNPTGTIDADRRRLPRHRPVELRQRLRARRLDLRQLHRGLRRRRAPAPHRGVLARPGRDRGHLERVGLSGTGSHHFHVDDVEVPADRTCVPMSDEPCLDEPIVRVPIPRADRACASPAWRSASPKARSTTSSPSPTTRCRCSPTTPLAANPLFQFELATPTPSCAPLVRCSHETAESMWDDRNVADHPFTLDRSSEGPRRSGLGDRASGSGRRAWPTAPAAAARSTPTARCSDGCATSTPLTQHFLVKRDTLTPRAPSSPARTST